MNERQMEKACKKEALQALKKQDQEQQERQAEQDMQRNKARITSHIDVMMQERKALVAEAVELRRTDPASAETLISMGSYIDDSIKQACGVLAIANSQALQQKVEEMMSKVLGIMRTINTTPVKFMPKKEIKKLHEQKRLHDMMQKLAREARMDELSIYTGGITPSDGKGSAFEADVLAAEKKAQIDEFDD